MNGKAAFFPAPQFPSKPLNNSQCDFSDLKETLDDGLKNVGKVNEPAGDALFE
jgi:hypothetical protein